MHYLIAIFCCLLFNDADMCPYICPYLCSRFRKGFKSVFRFLPCIHYTSGDKLGPTGVTIRTSVSEGTRFERNGSMMQTMLESFDETNYSANGPVAAGNRGVTWSKRKQGNKL